MPSARNTLLCFDAFGTLFAPKRPIAQQYGEVARSLGLDGFSDDDVNSSFRAAYKQEAKEHPNFGKAVGMNPQRWWTNIITNTFQPLVGSGRSLPHELVPTLLHRFWSDEGYSLLPGVRQTFDRLGQLRRADGPRRTVVGVITNSDDRVPDILTALGISVNVRRHGRRQLEDQKPDGNYDIDFVVMSFDVGHEKPDQRIFAAAEGLVHHAPASTTARPGESDVWERIYVGDEYDKDVRGACDARWKAVLIGTQDDRVKCLDEADPVALGKTFGSHDAVHFSDLSIFSKWLS